MIFYELLFVDVIDIFLLGCRVDDILLGGVPEEKIEVVFEMAEVDVLAKVPAVPHFLRILDVI